MGLALQKEYQEQLALVQEEIGFSHIRGHGLFSDDMAIYQEYTDEFGKKHAEYNFTYLDLVMDSYLKLQYPSLPASFGFMPEENGFRGADRLLLEGKCDASGKL